MYIARLHDHCLFGLIQVPFSRPAILSVATRVQAGSEQSTNFRGLVRVVPLLAVPPHKYRNGRASSIWGIQTCPLLAFTCDMAVGVAVVSLV